jgi:hypothetical protein
MIAPEPGFIHPTVASQERERRVRMYKEAPGFCPCPRNPSVDNTNMFLQKRASDGNERANKLPSPRHCATPTARCCSSCGQASGGQNGCRIVFVERMPGGTYSASSSSSSAASCGHPFSRAHCTTCVCPFSAAHSHVKLVHGQWCARAHFNTSSCPHRAACAHVCQSQGQWRSRAHFSISKRPVPSGYCTSQLVPRAVVLPQPVQHLHMSALSGVIHTISSQGQSWSRAHFNTSRCPP